MCDGTHEGWEEQISRPGTDGWKGNDYTASAGRPGARHRSVGYNYHIRASILSVRLAMEP